MVSASHFRRIVEGRAECITAVSSGTVAHEQLFRWNESGGIFYMEVTLHTLTWEMKAP